MAQGEKWTAKEEQYLQEAWGKTSIPYMAKTLKRTENAVIIRAQRMGLGSHLHSDVRVTYHQLIKAIYGGPPGAYTENRLIQRGIPVKMHRVKTRSFRVIDIEEFWDWAEKNKDLLNFTRFEPFTLGPEPEWAKLKRKIDIDKTRRTKKHHCVPWTSLEDSKLKRLLEKGTLTYTDIAKELKKTEGAIKRRIYDLGIREKPKRHPTKKWTDEDIEILLQMREQGYTWLHIAERMQRSELGVRGKYERLQNPDYMKRYYRDGRASYQYTGLREISPAQIRENLNLTKDLLMEDAPP